MGRPGWPELACSTASTDRKRMVLIASSSRLDCVMRGPLLVVSSRTAGPPSRDILPLALLAELPVRSVLPSRSQRALMSASPFDAMPAIRSFQDATNDLAPSAWRWTGTCRSARLGGPTALRSQSEYATTLSTP